MNDDEIELLDSFILDDYGPPPLDQNTKGFGAGLAPAWDSKKSTPAIPENFICLRNCRHYLETVSEFPHGNAPGTLDKVPMQLNRFCMRVPGSHIDLAEDIIFDCNQWAPYSETELVQIRSSRDAYYAQHPDHAPKDNV